jgi:hypothetical protein
MFGQDLLFSGLNATVFHEKAHIDRLFSLFLEKDPDAAVDELKRDHRTS